MKALPARCSFFPPPSEEFGAPASGPIPISATEAIDLRYDYCASGPELIASRRFAGDETRCVVGVKLRLGMEPEALLAGGIPNGE